jgi:hypothetical protein
MRRFGAIGVVLVLLLALVAGGIGYSLGMSNATASAITASGANVTYVVGAGGIGFPFFPLLFGFLLFMLVVGLIRRAAWGGRRDWYAMQMRAAGQPGHTGWAGPGGWAGRGPWCGVEHGPGGPSPDGNPAGDSASPNAGAASPSGSGTAA